jgi:toxin YoeB
LKIAFSHHAWEDYQYWIDADAKVLARLNALLDECRRSPFKGIGKPEPLKGELQGWWSRRLTQQDRLVYRVAGKGDDQRPEVAQCRFHY